MALNKKIKTLKFSIFLVYVNILIAMKKGNNNKLLGFLFEPPPLSKVKYEHHLNVKFDILQEVSSCTE